MFSIASDYVWLKMNNDQRPGPAAPVNDEIDWNDWEAIPDEELIRVHPDQPHLAEAAARARREQLEQRRLLREQGIPVLPPSGGLNRPVIEAMRQAAREHAEQNAARAAAEAAAAMSPAQLALIEKKIVFSCNNGAGPNIEISALAVQQVKALVFTFPSWSDVEEGTVIPINAEEETVRKMVAWSEHHRGEPVPCNVESKKVVVPEWDKKFLKEMNKDLLFKLTTAANYYLMTLLEEYCAKFIADMVKGMESERIAEAWAIPGAEEYAKMKAEGSRAAQQ